MANTLLGMFRMSGDQDPLADSGALGDWVRKQPINDYVAFHEAAVRLLEDMGARQPRVTQNRVLAVLELDRVSKPVQAQLLGQYLRQSLSDTVRQRLWHACDDLARWFAYTYQTVFEATQDFLLGQKLKGLLPGVVARMFHYRGQQARNGLFRYERWIPGKWKALHAVFESVQARDLSRVPFALLPEGPREERCSVEQEYVHTLLMQRVNTGNLSALQIDMAARWLCTWVHSLELSQPHAELAGPGFWLDLGFGDGLLTRRPQSPHGTLFYLDTAPLETEVGDGLVELSIQLKRVAPPAIQAEAAERLALLQRLEQLWRPAAIPTERRGERVQADRPVHVAAGIPEIAAALQGGFVTGDASRYRVRDPAAAVIVNGAVPLSPDEADAELIRGGDRSGGWYIQDTSESGCRLLSRSQRAAQQKLGSLLGIQEGGDPRWKIGVVRRLKTFSGGQTELGVEIVAQNSSRIAPKPVAARNTGYSVDGVDVSVEGKAFDALYLPPMQSAGHAPRRSIVVPALDYAERRRLFLNFENTAYTIELTQALERTKDWVWSGFDVVSQSN